MNGLKEPEVVDLELIRGDTFEFDIVLTDLGEDTVTSIYFSCKKKYTDEEYAFQRSLEDGITVIGENEYRVRVAPENTRDLKPTTYVYDLELGFNDMDIVTVMRGALTLLYDVTREGTDEG